LTSAHTNRLASIVNDVEPLLSVELEVSASGEAIVVDPALGRTDPAIVDVLAAETGLLPHSSDSSQTLGSSQEITYDEEHRVVYSTDLMGRSSIYSHTWAASSTSSPQGDLARTNCGDSDETEIEKKDVRVMSFNLWHNNPPSWVYHNHK
jgi:hypothetical protein